jgi:predicted Zn finger-like uncharacterized protein
VKFFCEQCKAKYQIADDKVAGKTVRMKCRKCGHVIELRAEVTESSAIAHAASLSNQNAPPGSAIEAAARAAPKPPARPPPRPNALATSLTSARPPSPKVERPNNPSGALAGAFKNTVQREEESSTPFDMADLAPGDDWYVAVNGVPVGPIRVAEVRRKAALGAVTEESLVWQEGLDEWRPLKTFPDLLANVREAATSGRISITPPPPDVRPSSPPPPRAPSPSMRTNTSSVPSARMGTSSRPMPTNAPGPMARSNVVPFTSRLATAERLDDAPTEIGAMSALTAAALDPFKVPAGPTPAPVATALERPPVAAAFVAPAAAGPASVVPGSVAAASTPTVDRGRKQPPWAVIALIAGSVAFGSVAAVTLFLRPAPPPAVVATPLPPVTTAAPVIPTSSAATLVPPADPAPVATTTAAPTAHAPSAGGAPHVAAPPANTGRSLDLHSLAGGSNVAPGEDPGGGDAPAAAGQCISGGQVQQVIQNHQLAIRRSCWERNPTAKPTVNVSVSMTVGADGSAQSVSASGDEISVAKCIENDVRGWRFPAMGCSQRTGFSFKFVRQ